jgi:hypothetical protein
MYNPAGDDAAGEFIELANTSGLAIDLSNVAFTAGVSATIAPGTTLEPGARLVLAREGAPVAGAAGTFTGSLANEGERLTLVAADGTAIADFEYNDRGAWPRGADGDGYSLQTVMPADGPPDYHDPMAWQTSPAVGGSPGAAGGLTYPQWRSSLGLPAGGDGTDADQDGATDLEEFFCGRDPLVPDGDSLLTAQPLPDGSGFVLTVPRAAGLGGVSLALETSGDIAAWLALGPEAFSRNSRPEGSAVELLEFTVLTDSPTGAQFARAEITSGE